MKSFGRVAVALGLVAGLAGSALTTAGAKTQSNPLKGTGEGLKLIRNVAWEGGTDMEFATIKGRDYAFAGSMAPIMKGGGFHVVDVTNPAKAKQVAWLKCFANQGDVQLSHDKKTALFALNNAGGPDSCLAVGKAGFLTIDIRNPKKPKNIGFAAAGTSHNVTAHPKKPIVYVSSSALAGAPFFSVWSIKNPAKPTFIKNVDSLPHAPHDISFNKQGTMAVTAAISHWDIFDTRDPANPKLLWTGQCPGCSITHDAKWTPDGKHILVGDEAGGGGTFPCPGGALYFYDVNGTETQPVPVLTGVYETGAVIFPEGTTTGSCTSHVMTVSPDGKRLAISWYDQGTRYLDISKAIGATFGENRTPEGIREIGWFIPEKGNSWSSKFHKGQYIYSNDRVRGLDVYKITAK